jgi:hypothetical protein
VSEPMLTIHNRHPAACGIPPAFSTEAADLYIGYFENRHGEQWIFTCDRATRDASLRGGDTDWASAHPVGDGRVDGLTLAPEEAAWLQAYWSATRASTDPRRARRAPQRPASGRPRWGAW